MTWTTEPPTAPGYYWLREPGGDSVIVEVYPLAAVSAPGILSAHWIGFKESAEVGTFAGEWCGPIPDPPGHDPDTTRALHPSPLARY